MTALRFGLLGPVTAEHEGLPVPLGPPQRRAVLAALLLARGRAVTVAALRDRIWPGSPPTSAVAAIQVHVHHLRRLFGAYGPGPRLVTHPGQPSDRVSYVLHTDPGSVDVTRFQELCGRAEATVEDGDPAGAAALFDSALGLWRGEPFVDLPPSAYFTSARRGMADLRLDAGKRRAGALLATGSSARVTADLLDLHAEHPGDEALVVLLATALCRSGARARALELVTGELDRWQSDYGLRPPALLRQRERLVAGGGGHDED